jgi:hypothetical protein
MHRAMHTKSTNGRFSILVAFCAAALTGCAGTTPLATPRAACNVGAQAVCATFGPARSCECVPRTEVDRFLTTLGQPGGLSGAR